MVTLCVVRVNLIHAACLSIFRLEGRIFYQLLHSVGPTAVVTGLAEYVDKLSGSLRLIVDDGTAGEVLQQLYAPTIFHTSRHPQLVVEVGILIPEMIHAASNDHQHTALKDQGFQVATLVLLLSFF